MLIDLITNASTFADYPAATIVHWLQGLVAGHLLIRGHHKKCASSHLYAIVLTALFLVYEVAEQLGIADDGWKDILNFGFMLHAAAAGTWIYYQARLLFSRRAKPLDRVKEDWRYPPDELLYPKEEQ